MLDLNKTLIDGAILSVFFLLFIIVVAAYKPRLFLSKEDAPADILAAVPPRTPEELRQAKLIGFPIFFMLIAIPIFSTFTLVQQHPGAGFLPVYLHALILILFPFLGDLIFIDWLLINTITPDFVVFPGTKGFAGYKDYAFHGRAHLRTLPSILVGAAIIAGLAMLLAYFL
jgi:hypothetical protein